MLKRSGSALNIPPKKIFTIDSLLADERYFEIRFFICFRSNTPEQTTSENPEQLTTKQSSR